MDDEQSNHKDSDTDTLFLGTFPEEVNQDRIRQIFQILQSQDRNDLTEDLKTLVKLAKAKVSFCCICMICVLEQKINSNISLGC